MRGLILHHASQIPRFCITGATPFTSKSFNVTEAVTSTTTSSTIYASAESNRKDGEESAQIFTQPGVLDMSERLSFILRPYFFGQL